MDSQRIAQPHLWFVRRACGVSGPFPLGALAQEDALGRLAGIEGVSPDGQRWFEPEVLRAALDAAPGGGTIAEWAGQRAMARERWADQRSGVDRRALTTPRAARLAQERRGGPDRRAWPETTRLAATPRDEPGAQHELRSIIGIVLLLVIAIALAAATLGPSHPVAVDLDLRPMLR